MKYILFAIFSCISFQSVAQCSHEMLNELEIVREEAEKGDKQAKVEMEDIMIECDVNEDGEGNIE